MKVHKVILVVFVAFIALTALQCEKEKQGIDGLPPITQEGKNTFGFLLNGEVWLPKGGLLDQKLDLSYDPNYKGGTFNIIASQNSDQYMALGNDGINQSGVYPLYVYFSDTSTECDYLIDRTKSVGILTISKIDLTNKFISGTFEFKLEKEGCPDINATDGRFDLKIE